MKILKSLSKKNLSIVIILLFICQNTFSEEKPVDIWNTDSLTNENNSNNNEISVVNEIEKSQSQNSDLFKLQKKKNGEIIELENNFKSQKTEILGLYDPSEFSLDINMWINSNGDQLKRIFSKLDKINLSQDASEIMKISMLTNAHHPNINITEEEFLSLKSKWLIKNHNLELIKDYLEKNEAINKHPNLTKFFVDHYLSESNIKKACEIFSKNFEPIKDEYLSKFNIYCLIDSDKKDQAQIIFDLKKELGFKDVYFEKKINYLLGFTNEVEKTVSEKSILDFHLARLTNPDFKFEPKETTNKIIWKYLSSSNLLMSFKELDTSELEKISTIEKATHNKNYPEIDLFNLYKRFQFNINQLLNAKNTYKTLSKIEARALIYQKILLESELVAKLELLKILKTSFKDDDIGEAFDSELKKFLENVDPTEVPDNLTSFYYTNVQINENLDTKIKFNNDILHQSKLINYFNGEYSVSKIEKDINNYLKKIKKNKKYFISKKDIIFLESLKSDGIVISKKYDNLYEIDETEIPTDIQVMINNNEKGAVLLRIAELIGQDKLERIDEDTIYFIISALNQLDIDYIRNVILMKVLPLKV